MSVDRRTLVRWIALGSVWTVAPGCRRKEKADPSGDDGCCPEDSGADGGDGAGDDGGSTDTGDGGGSGDDGGTDVCATAEDIEGPYYTAGAPELDDLTDGVSGTPLRITGRILDARDCETPLAGAVLDVWQADDDGVYDNTGYRLRGQVVCDADGAFDLRTILPGRYDVRPVRHIHFKVWVDGEERITSQFYFDDDERYSADTYPGPALSVDETGLAETILAV